jgi:hypothetical protein
MRVPRAWPTRFSDERKYPSAQLEGVFPGILVQLLSLDGRGQLGCEVEVDGVEHPSGTQADLGVKDRALPCDLCHVAMHSLIGIGSLQKLHDRVS